MISLITSIYSNKIHKYFFNTILEQSKHDFQLIIFTNDFSEEFSDKIKQIENLKNIKLHVIWTTKKIGFNEMIVKSMEICIGTHALILNPNENLSKTFIKDLNNIVEKNQTSDIFDFKTSIKGFEKWIPKKRCDLKPNHLFKINEYPEIVAYTFPFISNKLFKVSLGTSVSKKNSYIQTNSHLSIEFLYMLLLEAETYVYVDKIIFNIVILKNDIPNYMNFYKEWKSINLQYELKEKFIQEIEYAQMFDIEVIIPLLYSNKNLINFPFINSPKNKILLNKIYEKNLKVREANYNFFASANKYMLFNLLETEYLNKSHPPNKWPKISKIFRE